LKNKIIFSQFEAEKVSSFDYAQDKIRYGFVPKADKLFLQQRSGCKKTCFCTTFYSLIGMQKTLTSFKRMSNQKETLKKERTI
jgi:hypothetical protein